MAGSLSTLGIGSKGALSYDIIDQLKNADTASIIKPIENKIELNTQKQDKLSELTKLVSTLNTEVVALSDPAIYDSKTAETSSDVVSIQTDSKAKTGNYSLEVVNLATKDIKESQTGYAYDEALMGAGSMTLTIGTGDDQKSFTIGVESTDSIKNIVKKINESTDSLIEASLINVGGANPYHIVLKSANTGASNNIAVSGDFAFDQVGNGAKDATINLDGINITRSSNKIDDLIDGASITLEKEGKTNISIKQDNSKLLEGMDKFIKQYNALTEGFTESTKFDKDTKSRGLFQGNSSVRSAHNMLKDALILTTSKDKKTVNDFGLEMQRDGTIKFDKTKFEQMLKENPQSVEDFFRGTNGRDGAFNRLESAIFDIKTSSNGVLKSLAKNLEDDATRLQEQQKASQKRLDDRYSIMAKKFASYDAVIARLNSQGDTLTAMIDAELAKKN